MTKDMGASTGSRASHEAPNGSSPSGFDPARKVVVNRCYGGFGLSHEGVMRYAKIKGLTLYPDREGPFPLIGPTYWLVPPDQRPPPQDNWHEMTMDERRESNRLHKEAELTPRDIDRDDPALAQTVEELGAAASGKYAELRVVEIPADVEWQIEEYDGREWIAEKHRTW